MTPTAGTQTTPAPPMEGDAAERWIRAFASLYFEVEAGLRPVRHIRPLLATEMQLRLGGGGRPGALPRIRRVLVRRRAGVCEAVVVIARDGRASALVLAMRRQTDGWRVTEVARPESPAPAPAAATAPPPMPHGGWHEETVQPGPRPGWSLPPGWTRPPAATTPARAA